MPPSLVILGGLVFLGCFSVSLSYLNLYMDAAETLRLLGKSKHGFVLQTGPCFSTEAFSKRIEPSRRMCCVCIRQVCDYLHCFWQYSSPIARDRRSNIVLWAKGNAQTWNQPDPLTRWLDLTPIGTPVPPSRCKWLRLWPDFCFNSNHITNMVIWALSTQVQHKNTRTWATVNFIQKLLIISRL